MKLIINIAGASEKEMTDAMVSVAHLIGEGWTSGGIDLSNGGGFYFELEGKEPKVTLTKAANNAPVYRSTIKEGGSLINETRY